MKTVNETWRNVGSKIRYLRKANGLTLKQLARGCDLSPNTISMVERSEVAPSIETICKIATALGVSPSSLFLEICQPRVVLQRASPELLNQQITQQTLETFTSPTRMTSCSAKVSPLVPDSTESARYFILCLSGQVEIELDGQTYTLYPGDKLAFDSDGFHRWHNLGDQTGIAVLVLAG